MHANTERVYGDLATTAPITLGGLGRRWIAALTFVFGPECLTWAVWLAVTLGNVYFALKCSSFIPFSDDWSLVGPLVGRVTVDATWLWAPLADHRLPLAKLILYWMYRAFDNDFRIGMFANVACLSTLAAVMMITASKLRGRSGYADAFLPLATMNMDHEMIFVALGQSVVPAAVFAGIVLMLIAWSNTRLGWRRTIAFGLAVSALALCGPSGLAMVPPLALWLAYSGALQMRASGREGKWLAGLSWALAVANLCIIPLYFQSLERFSPPVPGVRAFFNACFQFLSLSFGQAARTVFSATDLNPPYLGIAVVILCLISVPLFGYIWWTRPVERVRATGLFAFLLAMGALTVSMAMARSGRGPNACYAVRYVLLAAPALWGLYFTWLLYGPRFLRGTITYGLLAAVACVFPFNVKENVQIGRGHVRMIRAAERDVLAGQAPSVIAYRHIKSVLDPLAHDWENFAELLRSLRRANISPFQQMGTDPVSYDCPFPGHLMTTSEMWSEGNWLSVEGDRSCVNLTLPKPLEVCAVRIRYRYEDAPGKVRLRASWCEGEATNSSAEELNQVDFVLLGQYHEETQLTILVNAVCDRIRIYPAEVACRFKLESVIFVLPGRHSYEGHLDEATTEHVGGWVWDRENPDHRLNVDIYSGKTLVATTPADKLREDLVVEKIGDGKHGFMWPTPDSLKDGKQHLIYVFVSGSLFPLSNSPMPLEQKPE